MILDRDFDPETILRSLDNMLSDAAAAGQDPDQAIGRFVRRLLLTPPAKGKPYERRRTRPTQSDVPTYRAQRSALAASAPNPERDAEYDAQLAAWEQQAAERQRER